MGQSPDPGWVEADGCPPGARLCQSSALITILVSPEVDVSSPGRTHVSEPLFVKLLWDVVIAQDGCFSVIFSPYVDVRRAALVEVE